jgi:hypothetical protein
MALHSMCIAHRHCWPALRTLARELGFPVDAERWENTRRTVNRHTKTLLTEGLLLIFPHFHINGSQTSNLYRIRYMRLRKMQPQNTTEAGSAFRPMKTKTQAKPKALSVSNVTGGVTLCHGGGDTGVTGGVSSVSPLELNLNVNEVEAEVGGNTERVAAPEKTASGGGVGLKSETGKPSGYWTGIIKRESLEKPEEVGRIYRDAVKAGLLANGASNMIRVRALAMHARLLEVERPGGYVIRKIEQRAWQVLSPEKIKEAVSLLGYPPLTEEQIAKIRTEGE